MSNIPFIHSKSGNLTMMLEGEQHTLNDSHPNFQKIFELLKKGEADKIKPLLKVEEQVKAAFSGSKVSVKNGVVFYGNEQVHNAVCEKILEFMREQFSVEPLVKFLEKLMLNPSHHSVNSLYEFLDRHGIVIDEDGDILAYKKVKDDFKDYHSGTLDNSVGQVVTLPRNKISDDPSHHCHFGLHCGALSYARDEFHPGQGQIVVVKVNPANVVSVPNDHNCRKMRVCEYKVISSFSGKEVEQRDVVASNQNEWDDDEEDLNSCYYDDYEDEDEDDDEEICDDCGYCVDDCDCENNDKW